MILMGFAFQESGADGPVKPLRQVIQQCESAGLVDLEIGGHTHSRPASVVQGNSPDQFLGLYFQVCLFIGPKPKVRHRAKGWHKDDLAP